LTPGDSVYNVPNHGNLAYCGFQGFVSVLQEVASRNQLSHPICNNLRAGHWMIEYIISRLQKISGAFPGCAPMYEWVKKRLEYVKMLPPSFIPKYFAIVIFAAYQAVKYAGLALSLKRVIQSDINCSFQRFYDACLMTTYQNYGSIFSAGLFPVKYPFETILNTGGNRLPEGYQSPCLAAGLPHFSNEFMRCWGRDIFIALPGLFLLPGHFEAARAHLIAFGSTLRHGLIPNLLDSGNKPRYNARDAVWFWMHAVSEYCRKSPEGYKFLAVRVGRRFIPKARYIDGLAFGTDRCGVDDKDADTYIPASDPRVYSYSNTVNWSNFRLLSCVMKSWSDMLEELNLESTTQALISTMR
jgi:glycogen debranching enzyme